MMLRIILFTVLFLINSEIVAFADSSFRCGQALVSVGDTKGEIIGKCGEPTSKEVTGEKTDGYSHGTMSGESIEEGRRSELEATTLERYSEISQKIVVMGVTS